MSSSRQWTGEIGLLSTRLETCLTVLWLAGCYLLGGLLTALLLAILLRSELRNASDRPTPRDVVKVVALWPAVVGMGVLFALITIGNRFSR